MLPAEVVSFDAAKREVKVKIMAYVDEPFADQEDVPVVFAGTDAFAIEFDLPAGTQGVVVYYMIDPDEYVRTKSQAQAKNHRLHGLRGEFWPRPNEVSATRPEPVGDGELRVSSSDGNFMLKVAPSGEVTLKAPKLNLASDAPSDAMALASLVDQELSTLRTAVSAGFDALVGAPSGPIGTPAKLAFEGAFNPAPVGSAKILGE